MSYRLYVSLFSLLILTCLPTSTSQAQQRVVMMAPSVSGASPNVIRASQAAATGPAAVKAATSSTGAPKSGETAEPEKTFEEKRIEALLKAKLDRSLPAVLKAWSYKEPEFKEDSSATPKKKDLTATVANIYDGFVVLEFEEDSKFKVGDLIRVTENEKEVGSVKLLTVEGKKVSGQFQPETKSSEASTEKKEAATAAASAPEQNSSKEETKPGSELAEKKADDAEDNVDAKDTVDATEDKPVETTEEKADSSDAEKQDSEVTETKSDDEVAPLSDTAIANSKPADSKPADPWESLKPEAKVVIVAPDDPAAKKAQEAATIKTEVETFTRNVTLGKWDEIKKYLATLKPEGGDKVYAYMLTALAKVPSAEKNNQQSSSRRGAKPETNFLTPDDIVAITEAAPKPFVISVTGNKTFAGLEDPISGKWRGTGTMPDAPVEVEFTFNLRLKGNTVTGDVMISAAGTQAQGPFSVEEGSFDPSTGRLTFSATDDEDSATIATKVDRGKMEGTFSGDGVSVDIKAELVVPAASAQPAKNPDATVAATALPPGITLPPGTSISDLPPELIEQLKARASADGNAAPASPAGGKSHVPAIARLIRNSKTAGFDFTAFVDQIKKGTSNFGGDDPEKKMIAADLFLKCGMTDEAEQFMPSLEDCVKDKDESIIPLKMWSQLSLSKYRQKKIAVWLERAWEANQTLVTIEEIDTKDRDAAMANLIELSPQIDREIGEKWLSESFTDSPERGMTVLTNLGTKSSKMASQPANNSEASRLKILRLQNGAVENLLEVSPELADQWSNALTLLANTWLIEAQTTVQYSSSSSRGYRQYDMYGNSYWVDENQYANRYGRSSDQPKPIKIGDLLEIAPGIEWQKRIEPTLKIQMQKLFASLHMRVNEEDRAFPYIEQIAVTNPSVAKELVHEFLRIWTRNHDPNTDRRERNPYIYFYGFDQKAEAIPLTRSKQERNLEELQGWVDRIRAMKIEKLDESLLANAFTTCHSSAEVYDLERVKSVFGDLQNLKPDTVAELCQKMRTNLSANWRDIRNQEQKQTKRRAPEVKQEVIRGYAVATELATEALKASPDDWKLHLALACLMFEENAYAQTVQKSSEFTDKRDLAFEQFGLSAAKYNKTAPILEEDEQSTQPFDLWFYAALGACDLGKVTNKTQPDARQYEKIRNAILELPGTLGESHMAKFANNLFTRMSPIKPEIKFRYLRGGFVIVADHPRAWEARNLYGYYKDLVSELKLQTVVDGSPRIGHEEPFGIYVNLLHTKEIERESGGFGKYVQNQNNMAYSYNYGRPTENYRDKFSESVKQALGEHFEIQSITFQSPETMQSVPDDKEGWRVTPYAYVLLKPRGSEVDRIAPLQLDMDFMDTSGYVVIPIESPALVVDATASKGEPRPVSDLKVTQTLDERQAEEGKLIVEISATAKGLVPPLGDILNVEREQFEVVSIDDQGVLPSRFDKESLDIQILSERSWTVEYRAKENEAELVEFSFGDAKTETADLKFQRYEDADLVEAGQQVSLERSYANAGWGFLYWLLPLIALCFAGIAAFLFFRSKPEVRQTAKFEMPEEVNPFTVLTLLKDIRHRNGISNEQSLELETSIQEVEQSYFGKRVSDERADLQKLASTWLQKAR